MTTIQQGLDNEVVSNVSTINQLTNQIVQLNKTIAQVEFNGQAANDLRDQRDTAIDRLSQMVQTSVTEIPGAPRTRALSPSASAARFW